MDFILANVIYFVTLHQKKKLKILKQTGEIIYSVKVEIPDVKSPISDQQVYLPGSTIPVEMPPQSVFLQKG